MAARPSVLDKWCGRKYSSPTGTCGSAAGRRNPAQVIVWQPSASVSGSRCLGGQTAGQLALRAAQRGCRNARESWSS